MNLVADESVDRQIVARLAGTTVHRRILAAVAERLGINV